MGLFNGAGSIDQDIWGYTKDDGEEMPLPEKENFKRYFSETEFDFDEEGFDEAMRKWHESRPLDYWSF